jgi:hypothetical protein
MGTWGLEDVGRGRTMNYSKNNLSHAAAGSLSP